MENFGETDFCCTFALGKVAEWSNAPVLKTDELRGSGGSNPSLSAKTIPTAEREFCRFSLHHRHSGIDSRIPRLAPSSLRSPSSFLRLRHSHKIMVAGRLYFNNSVVVRLWHAIRIPPFPPKRFRRQNESSAVFRCIIGIRESIPEYLDWHLPHFVRRHRF